MEKTIQKGGETMNSHTHYYLYAKGHYEKNDLWDDLKAIQAAWCGIEAEYIDESDISNVLLPLVFKHIKEGGNPEFMFIDFINRLDEHNACGAPDRPFPERLIQDCLSVLRYVTAEGLNLGEADPNILPLSKELERRNEWISKQQY
jgi:hypothetical protein